MLTTLECYLGEERGPYIDTRRTIYVQTVLIVKKDLEPDPRGALRRHPKLCGGDFEVVFGIEAVLYQHFL